MSTITRKAAVIVALATAAVAVVAAAAFATNNDTPYDSSASTHGFVVAPGVLEIGGSSSSSADNAGTSAHSSGSSLIIAGMDVSPAPTCDASASAGDNGVSEDSKSGSAQTLGDETTPAIVTLFTSSCYAQAQSNNNSHTTSSGSIADVNAPGAGQVTVGGTTSSTDTTSGEASSASDFRGVTATSGDSSVTVIHCSSTATADRDSSSTSSSATLLESGDQSQAFPDGVDCPAGSSEATYKRG